MSFFGELMSDLMTDPPDPKDTSRCCKSGRLYVCEKDGTWFVVLPSGDEDHYVYSDEISFCPFCGKDLRQMDLINDEFVDESELDED